MVRALDKWLLPWLKRKIPKSERPLHVFLAVCDHFEPLHDSNEAGALKRIGRWEEEWPRLSGDFRDVDGCSPKHTFFYPIEQYSGALLDPIARICEKTRSEVEIHLHHHDDTEEGLRQALVQGKQDLRSHGLLCDDEAGEVRYAFIHGNWALNHSHPEGEGCGVEREIPILRSEGCYADFTMPSAPSPTQSRFVNGIGYLPDLSGRVALDQTMPAATSGDKEERNRSDRLLTIQGPLALNWGWRKWGLIPKMENGDITGANPPTPQRMELAVNQRISVGGRPDWVFVKLHTHGGIEPNFEMILGDPFRRFHESLSKTDHFALHYVTAREMANLVHAAEDDCEGEPGGFRDYLFSPPAVVAG